jgi:hypothetical protein
VLGRGQGGTGEALVERRDGLWSGGGMTERERE